MYLILVAAAILYGIYSTLSPQTANVLSDNVKCPVYEPLAPASFYKDNSTVLKILHDQNHRNWSVANLAGAVQVDTQIVDKLPEVDESPESWKQFAAFHTYLESAFPEVHKTLKKFNVNTYGLVFYWEGSNSSLKPLMLTAHQDVVPVQKDTLKDWTYPPFEGHYDGKYLYGRGASDCKNSLVAVMEAIEILAKEGYKPARGVVLAFGFDEEASGVIGARHLNEFLTAKFGENGIYAVIDEGPGIAKDPMTGMLVAGPGTGEKGYVDIQVDLLMPGGHSSVPPDFGAVGIVGQLAYNIEQDPYTPLLAPENPILPYLQCVALNSGDKLSKSLKKTILRAGFDQLANLELLKLLGQNKLTKYLVQTSQAIDLVSGGEKNNALPEDVSLVVNHRVAIGQSVDYVLSHFAARVKKLGMEHGLNVEAFGETVYTAEEPKGTFVVSLFSNHTLESAPVSPSDDNVWAYLAGTTRHVFENLVLENSTEFPLITAPSIMTANTDTKFYWGLTRNIYRYSPMIIDHTQNNIHSVDEKIEFDGHLQLTAFYYEYIQNVDTPDADNQGI